MIDRRTFDVEIAVLAEMYRHDISGPTIDRYYDLLSPRMSTAAFRTVCRRHAMTPGGYWPKPADLVPPLHERETRDQLEAAALREGLGALAPAAAPPARIITRLKAPRQPERIGPADFLKVLPPEHTRPDQSQ